MTTKCNFALKLTSFWFNLSIQTNNVWNRPHFQHGNVAGKRKSNFIIDIRVKITFLKPSYYAEIINKLQTSVA